MRKILSHIVMLFYGIQMLGPFAHKVIAITFALGLGVGALIYHLAT